MTDSFIVYRNPIEAALWEGGYVFPIIVYGGVSLAATVLTDRLLVKYVSTPIRQKLKYMSLIIGQFAGAAAAYLLL